jgi:cation diffusion facilitator CzcD-associated flavoprotein CzcO
MSELLIEELLGPLDFDPVALKQKYLEERDKRVLDEGNDQYIEVSAEFSHYQDDPYVKPGFTREPLFDTVEVAIIGGGFGGLLAGARMKEAGFTDVRMIEQAGDFGGTWYWNRYPGAMCDVESYCYLPLLEEMGYIPKHKYSFAPEIYQHSQNIAKHYDLYTNACLQTSVTELTWDEDAGYWTIKTNRGDEMKARNVLMANGPLNRPKLPGIPGINDFKGHTFHTSRWDYNYTGGDSTGNLTGLKDKKVGIIGTGATAVQCIPALGASSEQLYVFQRTPSSIDVRNNAETDPKWKDTLEPGWQKARRENFNVLVSGGDQDVDLVGDGWTEIMRKLTGIAAKTASKKLGRRLTKAERGQFMEMADYKKMNQVRARAEEIVNDPKTAEALKPYYRQFCKRPCFHDEYLDTYNLPNVELVNTHGKGVERITEKGVVVDGIEYEVDCLVFATGFEVGTSYTRRAGYDINGIDKSLSKHWENGLRTMQGLQTNGFPNCFFLGFTQTAVTVNVPQALDEQAQHVAYILDQVRKQGKHVVEVTPQAEQAYVDEINRLDVSGTRFYTECTPGYYNNEGKEASKNGFFTGMYGGGSIRFFKLLAHWRDQGDMKGLDVR